MLLMVFSIIFYFFSSMVYDFAAELSGGVNVKGVSINAVESVVNGAKMVMSAIINKSKPKDKDDDKGKDKDKGKDDDKGKESSGDTSPKRGDAPK